MTNPTSGGTAGLTLPGDWAAEPAASTITFAVRNFGLRTVTGQIPLSSAVVIAGPGGRPAGIRAELDARGIDTGNRRRDSDLRGPRFLATGRWPAITFEASDIQANGTCWTIDGTLTVKDTRCPVRLNVGRLSTRPAGPAGPVHVHATGSLDRRAAGVEAAPAFLVGHRVALSLSVQLCPPAAVTGISPQRPQSTVVPAEQEERR
jgi:polyisoprenoid-binding protein YceI